MTRLLVLMFGLVLAACGSDPPRATQDLGSGATTATDPSDPNGEPLATLPPDSQLITAQAVIATYAANLYQAYADSVTGTEALQASINAFLAAPTETTLTAARQAWIDSRLAYMQTEGARFYGGPIDTPETGYEALINSWPLDEAYIDYSTDAATGVSDDTVGIINNPSLLPTITADALVALNGKDGDTNISTGYHAIEFLLWGQALNPIGPGERKATDYLLGPGATHKNAERRQDYLREVTRLLLTSLRSVRDAWDPANATNYRATFVDADPKESLGKIIVGLGKMSKGELASQRLNAAYLSKDRKDQHDCFSSLTLVDYQRNVLGLQNIYLGRYGDAAGPSLDGLVQQVNPELNEKMKAQLQASRDALAAVPAPFEQAFLGADTSEGRQKVFAVIAALRTQADTLVEVADALGIQVNVPDDND